MHAGAVVSIDRLIAALWGDEVPATAVESLRTYVYRLRDTLDGDGTLIATRPPGYVLEVADDEIDAGRFEQLLQTARREVDPRARLDRLEEGLGLWRGPAYAELADEEVTRAEAARLEELRRVAEEERLDAKLALGEHAEVVGDLEAFVAHHPLREQARGQLMLALYRCGRQADALAAFRSFRELLDEELGLEPSDELRALEGDILRRSAALDAPAETQAAVTADTEEPVDAPLATGGAPEGAIDTLPGEPTELVGRDTDVAEVSEALRQSRLVTVLGVGGIGKTRVALRAARQVASDHPDSVWWCELAPGVEPLVRDVMAGCPDTAVLATSRAPLGLAGERVHRLAPLPVGPGEHPDADDSPALALFEARSRAVRPDLEVDAAERARMADICRRLDGLPLAIERAVLDWSYGLLGAVEQRLFARLSVFAGAFTLEAAEQVAGGDGVATDEVLDCWPGWWTTTS